MIRIEWTDPAVADLQTIVTYIARDSVVYADTMAEQIISSCETMAAFPQRGRVVAEAGNPKIREIIVEPYRVIYRIKRSHLEILAVIHGARDVWGMKRKPWK